MFLKKVWLFLFNCVIWLLHMWSLCEECEAVQKKLEYEQKALFKQKQK